MVRTISLTTRVPKNRELRIVLPGDVPAGKAEILLTITSPSRRPIRTLGHLARSEFAGMWRKRADIRDSAAFAATLRSAAWSRGR
jgi:hypothetical protein